MRFAELNSVVPFVANMSSERSLRELASNIDCGLPSGPWLKTPPSGVSMTSNSIGDATVNEKKSKSELLAMLTKSVSSALTAWPPNASEPIVACRRS